MFFLKKIWGAQLPKPISLKGGRFDQKKTCPIPRKEKYKGFNLPKFLAFDWALTYLGAVVGPQPHVKLSPLTPFAILYKPL